MSKNGTIILLGILIAIIPFLGFPGAWKTVLIVILGLMVAGVAFLGVVRERSAPPKILSQSSSETSQYDKRNEV